MATAKQRLTIIPVELDEANRYVLEHHRHHSPVRGYKYALGVIDETETVRGVAIVGRPTSRHRDDGVTLEVTRVATDGCPNACSALYGAAWRAARALGYHRIGTYTLVSEPGTSLRAAGWQVIAQTDGGSWSRTGRPRVDTHPLQAKLLWEPTSS